MVIILIDILGIVHYLRLEKPIPIWICFRLAVEWDKGRKLSVEPVTKSCVPPTDKIQSRIALEIAHITFCT